MKPTDTVPLERGANRLFQFSRFLSDQATGDVLAEVVRHGAEADSADLRWHVRRWVNDAVGRLAAEAVNVLRRRDALNRAATPAGRPAANPTLAATETLTHG